MSADKKEAVSATQRVQFEMTQTSFDDLRWAKEKLGAVSYAEVVRRILRVFRYIYDGSGRRIPRFYIQDEDGGITEIFF